MACEWKIAIKLLRRYRLTLDQLAHARLRTCSLVELKLP
jgi:hypothetical protein